MCDFGLGSVFLKRNVAKKIGGVVISIPITEIYMFVRDSRKNPS